MKKLLIISAILLSGCAGSHLKESLNNVTGKNISVIGSYPDSTFTAINGNTVYKYAQTGRKGAQCEVFFEVNHNNNIVLTSYRGKACNSFYNKVLRPKPSADSH